MPMMVVIDRRRRRLLHRIGGRDRSHSKRALDPADNAANRAADHRPDRTSGLIADISTVRGAVGNALRLRGERASERCGNSGRDYDMELHAVTSLVY